LAKGLDEFDTPDAAAAAAAAPPLLLLCALLLLFLLRACSSSVPTELHPAPPTGGSRSSSAHKSTVGTRWPGMADAESQIEEKTVDRGGARTAPVAPSRPCLGPTPLAIVAARTAAGTRVDRGRGWPGPHRRASASGSRAATALSSSSWTRQPCMELEPPSRRSSFLGRFGSGSAGIRRWREEGPTVILRQQPTVAALASAPRRRG
ncbi:unnamed protein product, partial [Urochloa humidicola]